LGAGDSQVVDSSADAQPADVAAWELQRLDDIAVDRQSDLGCDERHLGCIQQLIQIGIAQARENRVIDQLIGELTSAAVGEHDAALLAGGGAALKRLVLNQAHVGTSCSCSGEGARRRGWAAYLNHAAQVPSEL